MLTMEMYVVLIKETVFILASSTSITLLVVSIITGSFRIGLIITISLLLMIYFLLALIPLVSLTFNNLVIAYFITSIAFSVLYSVQMAHTFNVVPVKYKLEPKKQRNVRARIAMSRMVVSVFHSAMITLIAILIIMINHKSYFFEVFTKLWLGIIIFGLLNAFFIVPVILSLYGPTQDYIEKE